MARPESPRFVIRTLIATLAIVAFVLSAVLLLGTRTIRDHIRRSVGERLETGQRLLNTLDQRRAEQLRRHGLTLADSPTPNAVLDDVATELQADVVAVRGADGALLAVAGRHSQSWATEVGAVTAPDPAFLILESGAFRTVTAPLTLRDGTVGSIQLAQLLDEHYTTELSALSGVRTLIVSTDRVIATSLPQQISATLTRPALDAIGGGGTMSLGGEEYAVRQLLRDGNTAIYLLDSIDAAARPLLRASLRETATIGWAAVVLATIVSLWLAYTLSHPIGSIASALSGMAQTRKFNQPLRLTGVSRETDNLTDAVNSALASITAAESETLKAAVEAIGLLITALDARDPCKAGHSERVSALSVAIGREMKLDERALEVLRLGALLHDIGKIGISDQLLRKPGPLTPAEYDIVKTHPTLGSRILRHVRFLEPHLPIVELHHERQDGGGYPRGLAGERIPLLARIVHVADAYDAMTTARAHRPALPAANALAELSRGAGADFDPAVVRAVLVVLSREDAVTTEMKSSLDAFRAEATLGPTAAAAPAAVVDALDEFASEAEIV